MFNFEQGPIRPPSEANSMLVRVSRNCPWNRCAFCSVYKGTKFSLRPVDDVLADLDQMLDYFGPGVASVFLQDANALLTRVDDLVRILEGISERFPQVQRITTYARSHTLAHRSAEQLARIRKAGLTRVHIGMESGCDRVLKIINKGTTRDQQIAGGIKAREAGFEVSEYYMPGLGGKELSTANADDTASALRAIRPAFIRLRTTLVVPGTGLDEMMQRGEFEPLTEVEGVAEIRRFVDALGDLEVQLESDHVMNLLMGVRGHLPNDRDQVLALCDEFLNLPAPQQAEFIARRRQFGMRLL